MILFSFYLPSVFFQDQYENLSLHTQKGIEFLERYGHFIRDRCAIEFEYAAKLRWEIWVLYVRKKKIHIYNYTLLSSSKKFCRKKLYFKAIFYKIFFMICRSKKLFLIKIFTFVESENIKEQSFYSFSIFETKREFTSRCARSLPLVSLSRTLHLAPCRAARRARAMLLFFFFEVPWQRVRHQSRRFQWNILYNERVSRTPRVQGREM